MTDDVKIVVAEDHQLLAEAYAHLLRPIGTVVATVRDGEALVDAVRQWSPNLVLTDLSMPGAGGMAALLALRHVLPPPPCIVVTVRDEYATMRAALEAGARGYVLKSAASSELLKAARIVLAGGQYISEYFESNVASAASKAGGVPWSPINELSQREREVLALVAAGATAREVAARLGISERTVNFHKDRLKQRLGVRSTIEAVKLLIAEERRGT